MTGGYRKGSKKGSKKGSNTGTVRRKRSRTRKNTTRMKGGANDPMAWTSVKQDGVGYLVTSGLNIGKLNSLTGIFKVEAGDDGSVKLISLSNYERTNLFTDDKLGNTGQALIGLIGQAKKPNVVGNLDVTVTAEPGTPLDNTVVLNKIKLTFTADGGNVGDVPHGNPEYIRDNGEALFVVFNVPAN